MRTRIVTCATMEGECIWYSEINYFFAHLVLRKAIGGEGVVYQFQGWERGVRKPEITESILGNILGQMLLIDIC